MVNIFANFAFLKEKKKLLYINIYLLFLPFRVVEFLAYFKGYISNLNIWENNWIIEKRKAKIFFSCCLHEKKEEETNNDNNNDVRIQFFFSISLSQLVTLKGTKREKHFFLLFFFLVKDQSKMIVTKLWIYLIRKRE